MAFLVMLLPATGFATGKDNINGFDLTGLSVPRHLVAHGGPGRDGIPALTDPAFMSAREASYLLPGQRVLGVYLNGVAKAYPLGIMNWHEIVNDQFGTEPVVVTYCPLCFTGIAFKAEHKGKRQIFGVSGLLYNNDVLLYDRETESLWSQVMSEAIGGSRKGDRLEKLPVANTTWGDWVTRHPDTLVLSLATGHARDYDRNPYASYDVSGDILFPVAFRAQGYHPKERVLGVTINGEARAYPFIELRKADLPVTDVVAGKLLKVDYYSVHDYAVIHDESGKEIPSVMSYWFAWYAFYPETGVFKAR